MQYLFSSNIAGLVRRILKRISTIFPSPLSHKRNRTILVKIAIGQIRGKLIATSERRNNGNI